MFNIANCCRICLIPDDTNKDLYSIKDNGVSFIEKLQVCVPEVIWIEYDTLPLCTNCIEKLNKVYEFKKLCFQSHTLYKKLSELCNWNGIKKDGHKKNGESSEIPPKPNQTFYSNLCIIPMTMEETKCDKQTNKSTQSYTNASISIVRSPITSTDLKQSKLNQKEQENVMLQSKTEEVSIEIDPMDYDLSEENMYPMRDCNSKDWDDAIEANEVRKANTIELTDPVLQDFLQKKIKNIQEDNVQMQSGHFLTGNNGHPTFPCDICFKTFESAQILWYHKKHIHNCTMDNNMPELNSSSEVIDHDNLMKNSITLDDFTDNKQPPALMAEMELETDYQCNNCKRYFSSAKRLSRHIETYHSNKPPRKYFTKGTKNARCDICDKEVSTQAYLQIHKKLHYRKGEYEPFRRDPSAVLTRKYDN